MQIVTTGSNAEHARARVTKTTRAGAAFLDGFHRTTSYNQKRPRKKQVAPVPDGGAALNHSHPNPKGTGRAYASTREEDARTNANCADNE